MTNSDDSVLARLTEKAPSPDAVQQYEVVRDLIAQVLALYSQRRHEREQAGADQGELDEIAKAQSRYARLLQSLNVDDHDLVARIHAECLDVLVRARG